MNLWGQVITLREQILVDGTGDDTLRVLCCVLCDCAFVRCVLLVCNVWVLVCVLVCHAEPPSSSHPSPRVYVQNVPMCTGTTPACGITCGRGNLVEPTAFRQ